MSQRTDFGRNLGKLPAWLRGPAATIYCKVNAVTGACEQNMRAWAACFDCCERHARRIMRELEALGIILIEPRQAADGSYLCNRVVLVAMLSKRELADERKRIAWRKDDARRLWWQRKRIAAGKREKTLAGMLERRTHELRKRVFGELGLQIAQILTGEGADIVSRTIQEYGAIYERFSPSNVFAAGVLSLKEALERERWQS